MENKEKNADINESSLLLQLPRSMFSFSDMSGNSFLMPVAVEKVNVDLQNPQNISAPDMSQGHEAFCGGNSSNVGPLCQLEQPLLMRKTSSPGPQTQLPNVTQVYSTPAENPGNRYLSNNPEEYSVSAPVASNVNAPHVDSFPGHSSSGFASSTCEPPNFVAPPDYYSQFPTTSTGALPVYNANIPQTAMPLTSPVPHDTSVLEDRPLDLSHMVYEPVKPHWFFRDVVESKEMWYGFSETDSTNLEAAFQQDPLYSVIPTDGGRYDVYLGQRIKKSVYFDVKDLHVRRCTWFYRSEGLQRFIPYEEETSLMLEQHFYNCVTKQQWQKRLSMPGSGVVVIESPQVILHYSNGLDVWPAVSDSRISPQVAKRGIPEEFELVPDESSQIDHLVFIVQGIGSFCDLRFRTVSQCVDGFRDIANRLIASHFKHEVETGRVGRVEFLPLAWHAKLHTSDIGLDRRMQTITLPSIPKLRHFTNDTLLDILLYSSPSYCQSIIDTVAYELNKLYDIFMTRNPNFCDKVSVAGHSLGSLILFDILANQPPEKQLEDVRDISEDHSKNITETSEIKTSMVAEQSTSDQQISMFSNIESLLEFLNLQDYTDTFQQEKIDLTSLLLFSENDLKDLGLPKGPCKKLLNFIQSEDSDLNLVKQSKELQSLSTAESSECLTSAKGTCDDQIGNNIYNGKPVSHPSTFPEQPPKSCMSAIVYPSLRFEPACFFALGSPISMFLAVRGYETISEEFRFPTCPAFFHIFHPYDPVAFRVEPLIDPNFSAKPVLIPHHKGRKRMHIEIRENLTKVGSEIKQKVMETLRYTWNSLSEFAKAHAFPSDAMEAEVEKLVKEQMSESEDDMQGATMSETSYEDVQIGCLNGGRRIDFVLQEKPIEALNDYIFALTSHATYWDSEDTVLMILKEVYAMQGITLLSKLQESRPISQNGLIASGTTTTLDKVSSTTHSFEPTRRDIQPEGFVNVPSTSYNPYSDFPHSTPMATPSTNSLESNTIVPPPSAPPAQHLGPPPLSGFVRKSPFAK